MKKGSSKRASERAQKSVIIHKNGSLTIRDSILSIAFRMIAEVEDRPIDGVIIELLLHHVADKRLQKLRAMKTRLNRVDLEKPLKKGGRL